MPELFTFIAVGLAIVTSWWNPFNRRLTDENNVLAAINGLKESLTERLDSLEGNFTELKGEFTELKANVSERFDSLEESFTERLDSLEGNVSERLDRVEDLLLAPFESQKLARMCAVSVSISPPSKEGNDRACGTLVRLNDGNFYALTSRHVVIDSDNGCRRRVSKVTTIDDKNIPVLENEIKYSWKDDLAVIPLDFAIEGQEPANFCEVAQDDSELLFHAELFGISPREKETRAVYGRVLAFDGNIVKGDFQGTNGFSGTGYFFNRKVVAVHKGAGQSRHWEELWEGEMGEVDMNNEEYSKKALLNKRLENATMDMIRAPLGDEGKLAAAFVTELGGLVRYEARNPEAHAVKAYLAHDGLQENIGALPLCNVTKY